MQYVHASACDIAGRCMHVLHHAGQCMHMLHVWPHDVTSQCMQLLHGLWCFDFVSDIPLLQLLFVLPPLAIFFETDLGQNREKGQISIDKIKRRS
jgi:hypothetical protein